MISRGSIDYGIITSILLTTYKPLWSPMLCAKPYGMPWSIATLTMIFTIPL